jgi:pimeloyl-ACP methyl ester carboxylesterase
MVEIRNLGLVMDATLVLLHGGGRGSWCWEGVTPLLDAPAMALDLPGRRDPGVLRHLGLDASATAILRELDANRVEDSILVGHSLGGLVAVQVAARATERCRHLVLIASALPPPGQSLLELTPRPARWYLRRAARGRVDPRPIPRTVARFLFCNDMDRTTAARFLSRLGPEAPRLRADPVSAPPSGLPITYVKLLRDRAVSPRRQDRIARRLKAQVLTIDSGHEAPVTHPEAVATVLNSRR